MKKQDYLFYESIEKIVNLHLSNPKLNGAFVAKKLKISRMTLHRRLKKQYNQNAYRYILDSRMKKAKKLLKITQKPISIITTEVGFVNRTHFSKVFKKVVGCTPSAYRKIEY